MPSGHSPEAWKTAARPTKSTKVIFIADAQTDRGQAVAWTLLAGLLLCVLEAGLLWRKTRLMLMEHLALELRDPISVASATGTLRRGLYRLEPVAGKRVERLKTYSRARVNITHVDKTAIKNGDLGIRRIIMFSTSTADSSRRSSTSVIRSFDYRHHDAMPGVC